MNIEKIALNGYRNYEFETVEFSPGINIITGANAQGKTNLLEAVYMLSGGKSFRTRFDRELIGFDYSQAEIMAVVNSFDRQNDINIVLRQGMGKIIKINSVKKSLTELSEIVNTVLFCPDDLNLIKEGASVRRKMMDNAISQLRPRYGEIISSYNKLYENKTRILKDWHEKPALLDTLDEFSDGLCRASAKIIRYRAAFVEKLKEFSRPIHLDFSSNSEILDMNYNTISTVSNPFASEKEIYYEICEHQERHRKAEIDSCQCLTGAHKDDLEIFINGKSAKNYASQGQTRTAALSIKLAEREIFLNETGEAPILLLDDVLSELDTRRQEFVLNRIGGGQTLITCCEDEGISGRTGGKVIFIDKGRIR